MTQQLNRWFNEKYKFLNKFVLMILYFRDKALKSFVKVSFFFLNLFSECSFCEIVTNFQAIVPLLKNIKMYFCSPGNGILLNRFPNEVTFTLLFICN